MKKGDLVIPKDFPELKGTIIQIDIDHFGGETLYILDNKCVFTENELL